MKNFLLSLIIVGVGYVGLNWLSQWPAATSGEPRAEPVPGKTSGDSFETGVSGGQFQGSGTVVKLLPDDNDGRRHQKFIIRLASGRTLLVAHNIDIAPRVASLRVGDRISFRGMLEENPEGGVVHWTHHDPGGRHAEGWLQHGSRTYR